MSERERVTVAGVSVDHYVGGRRVSSPTTFEDRSPLDWSTVLAEVSAGDSDVADHHADSLLPAVADGGHVYGAFHVREALEHLRARRGVMSRL